MLRPAWRPPAPSSAAPRLPRRAPARPASERRRQPAVRFVAARRPASPPDGDGPRHPRVARGHAALARPRDASARCGPHQWVKNLFVLAPIVFAKELTRPALHPLGARGVRRLLPPRRGGLHPERPRRRRGRPRPPGQALSAPSPPGASPSRWPGRWSCVLVTRRRSAPRSSRRCAPAAGPSSSSRWPTSSRTSRTRSRLKKVAYVDVGFIAARLRAARPRGRLRHRHARVRLHDRVHRAARALPRLRQAPARARRRPTPPSSAPRSRRTRRARSPSRSRSRASPRSANYLAYTLDPAAAFFQHTHWLWLTTVHPLFGVVRFLQLVVDRPKAESPTQEMLRDVPFVLNLVLWVVEVLAIVGSREAGRD